MEAVVVREHCLKLHQKCKNIRQPTDIIRHLEDEFSRAEAKLTNFSELKLSEADRCSVLLQALGPEVRQYVLLHGSSSDWDSLRKSLTHYEEQLRLCEIPVSNRALNTDLLCDYCGKRGHVKKDCWKWKKEQKEKEAPRGKEDQGGKGPGKTQDTPKGKGDQPKGHPDPKGKGKGKDQKGKPHKKKKPKGKGKHRAMDGEESEPESEAGSATRSQSVMALRLGSWTFSRPDRALSPLGGREVLERKSESSVSPSEKSECNYLPAASKYEAARICSQHGVDPRDLWLVDSGATCHVVSREFLSSFRVVKQHDQKPVLYNASSDEIPVHGLVDLEVQFGNLNLVLEGVVVADVAFNALSPWSACERGWRTHLFKNGARIFRGKRSVRLLAANRAWWAVSGQRLKAHKPKKAADDMELDRASCSSLASGASVSGPLSAGANSDTEGGEKKEEAGTLSPGVSISVPPGLEESALSQKRSRKKVSVKKLSVSDTPFAYLVRGLKHCPATPENTQETELAAPRNTEEIEPEHENRAFLNLACMIFLGMFLCLVGNVACLGMFWLGNLLASLVADVAGFVACLVALMLVGRRLGRFILLLTGASLSLAVNAQPAFRFSSELQVVERSFLAQDPWEPLGGHSPTVFSISRKEARSSEDPAAEGASEASLWPCPAGFGDEHLQGSKWVIEPGKVAVFPVFPTAERTIRRFVTLMVHNGPPKSPKPPTFEDGHLEGSESVVEPAKLAIFPTVHQTTRIFDGIMILNGHPKGPEPAAPGRSSVDSSAKVSVRCGGFRLLRVVLRVLCLFFRAFWFLWNTVTNCVFEALFLGLFGVLSGLLVPGVLWLCLTKGFRKPRYRRHRSCQVPREPQERIRLQNCWRRFPAARSTRLLSFVCFVRSGVLGSPIVFGSSCAVGCQVEHAARSSCDARVLLCPSVVVLRGLPVVVDLEEGEGAEQSASSVPKNESEEVAQESELVPERPPEPVEEAKAETEAVSLSSRALREHQSHGHQPYLANCDACLCARGRCPARRIRDPQRMSSAIGMDYLFFGKLRVLLMVHEMTRYTLAIPAQEDAKDDPRIVEAVGNMIKEIGLQNRVITLRCDNENLLLAFGNHLASKVRQLGVERVIVDPVPGYRPQAKGGVEKQVSVVKQAFWSNWLGIESEISRKGHEEEPLKLPLGGRLWSMCLLYVSRTINLFLCSPGDVATPLDLVHDEICSRPKTLPFGSLCACQVAGPRLVKKYRGRKLIRCIYLGRSRARGGGVLAIPVGSSGSKEVEVFPACRGILDNDRFVFLKDELLGIAGDDHSVLDVSDPERPINFVPQDRKRQRSGEEALEDDDEELIPDRSPEGFRPGYQPELGYDPERGFQGTDSEYAPSDVDPAGFGDMEIDEDGDARMEEDIEAKLIDLLVNESLLGIYRGPDLRSVGSGKSRSFEVPFCGSVIRCIVPDNAISETTGEKLDPELLLAAMKLELQELENFKIGKVVSEDYAKKLARTHGRRVLSSRWVNTIKKPGLYRARLVVRDFASFGGSTLQEGIYSPTTTLEGLRLLLALVSVSGTLISGDVSVAFMHADCARVEVIQMPSNVSLAKKGGVVFVELRKAVNGLRSAPLSWYREISQFLECKGFTQVIDPTIYRRFTRGAKGETFLSVVLFYVDDILIWSQIPGEAEAIFGMLAKKYKLKQTGIIAEHKAGEVSFLGRKVFRTKEFEGTNVIFFGLSPEYLESCCKEFKITKGTDKLPSLERLVRDFEKKGTPEKLSPEAHDRYRRVLGKLAWASLTRPDLAFVTGFWGRFQAGPTEASEPLSHFARDCVK